MILVIATLAAAGFAAWVIWDELFGHEDPERRESERWHDEAEKARGEQDCRN